MRYGIDPNIAVAQFLQENGCRPVGCSGQGACGIAQFIPATAAAYGLTDRNNVAASLDAWGRYMRDLLNAFGGDYRLALAGYHSGQGAARAALNNCAGNPRTCSYVNSILGNAGNASGDGLNMGARSLSPVILIALGVIAFLALR